MCLFCTVCILLGPSVLADKIEHPIRLRIDSKLIKRIFKKGDETILENFKDIDVGQIPPIPEIEEDEDEDNEEQHDKIEEGSEEKQEEDVKEQKPAVEIPEAIISDLLATIKPKTETGEDYDFTMALNDDDLGYLGLQGDDLILEGSGKIAASQQEFKFTADVSLLRMRITQTPEEEPEVLKFNPNAEKFL